MVTRRIAPHDESYTNNVVPSVVIAVSVPKRTAAGSLEVTQPVAVALPARVVTAPVVVSTLRMAPIVATYAWPPTTTVSPIALNEPVAAVPSTVLSAPEPATVVIAAGARSTVAHS